MSEFWTAFGQALLILAATALFVVWVICTIVGVAGRYIAPRGLGMRGSGAALHGSQ